MTPRTPLIIAHRGASADAPENTLPAFLAALAQGADVVELDYRTSADGVPVVIHDETLDRTTDAAARWCRAGVRVCDEPLARLGELDAGSWFEPPFHGTPLPTLSAALATICPHAPAAVERKSGDAATLVELLSSRGWIDRVRLMAFDWRFLAECGRLAPNLSLVALGEGPLDEATLDAIVACGARAAGWNERHTTAASVAAIHRRGLASFVWTSDSPDRWAELISAGVDGITTNRPAELRDFLAARGD